jgi:hypothetical protein
MPYKIEQRDGKYCVVKADSGETMKCYGSESDAKSYLGALYANVDDAKMHSLPASLSIVKTADGRYRWTSISSNNALDRDGEIVSSQALELDVYRSKMYGDQSELRIFHLPYALGGAPDFRAVVDGHLVETGEFYEAGIAKSVAEWMMRNPDAPDGSGWGTSIGFRGYTDDQGIYHQIEITERSVLPLSSAANPYTSFSTLKEANMPIAKRQQEFLDQMLTDPEMRAAAAAIIEASNQSKALDQAGVQRKQTVTNLTVSGADAANAFQQFKDTIADASGTQYAGGPGGVFSTPGTNGKADKAPADDPKCANCDHLQSAHGKGGCGADGCDCKAFEGSAGKALREIPEPPPKPEPPPPEDRKPRTKKADKPAAAQPMDKSILNLTLDGLAEVIDQYVAKSLVKYTNESPDMQKLVEVIKAQSEAIAEVRQTLKEQVDAEERIKARYETPRMLSDLLASRSTSNVVDDTDPLVKQANAALEDDTSLFSKLGLGKGS